MPEPFRSARAGRYVRQPTNYAAFIPAGLPPDPPVDLARLAPILSAADQGIGRLDGVSRTLPNPDLFVAMYVRREAVLSSQIEGTQSSLDDVLAYELDATATQLPLDVEEVFNHVASATLDPRGRPFIRGIFTAAVKNGIRVKMSGGRPPLPIMASGSAWPAVPGGSRSA